MTQEDIKIDRRALLQRFCSLVAIDNESFDERAMADAVIAQLSTLGLTAKEDDAAARIGGNAGNLYACLEGTGALADAEPIALCAHLDSVAPARGKRALIAEDGSICSAGDTVLGADDLSAVAAMLETVRLLQEYRLPHRPTELLFTVCEEPYTLGSRALQPERIPLRSRKIFVPDLTGQVGTAALAAPSIVALTITVTGRASHAGFAPEKGIHAIAVAARALSKLKLGHVDSDTTVGIGTIHGGTVPNAVPEQCVLQGEIRGYADARVREELVMIRTIFEAEAQAAGATVQLVTEQRTRAYAIDAGAPIVTLFRDACRRADVECLMTRTFGGSDANTFAERGYQTLVIANAMERIHSVQERSHADELERLCRLLMALVT